MKEIATTTRDIARELARKYSTMTHEELDTLESILVPMKFAKGDMILKEGDLCDSIYYIEKGLIRQFYFKNGKEVTEHLGEDHTIVMCIESLFKEEPTRLQVEALEPTLMYGLPKKRLEEEAIHNTNIQMLYRKILEESLIISQVHADLVRFESAQNRYKKMCKLSPQVILRAPLVYIANYLQMTPETLSRVRAASLLDDE
ncbi:MULTISPECIES: Crp/Fnr family transcriptional regulator [Segatella]|jgi:CRP-like cAMP-binding protein|uniref:Cyclic nucleotide-binding domain protein n=2 Tax=Segatella TaxID=2974251 RepID=D8DYS8_9BACT|nr:MULTISPECIES: Crp/Fnr family transcriptional regulator [Segatella]MBQ3858271.1 Crp/Fnr family transcriptional regulator [Prevotella sp.]EFI71400.1 cyclic nucleotide-binding domain protein [Segatella baroniae B14]MDR4929976.1 Crp/Fnr family transcriptional regulator [Segatella bryantii]MEE3415369.1 Crp/Fnr family transcriptional regulator [Prevotella sp.]OYP56688.1 Crp/Fnr family transcriptional regulator [Segatella bryantii]